MPFSVLIAPRISYTYFDSGFASSASAPLPLASFPLAPLPPFPASADAAAAITSGTT